MSESRFKTRDQSQTTMTELVLPNDVNLLGNLLGGNLLHLIDVAGAMAACRHSESLVATITMDMVEFKRPAKLGTIVTLFSYVTWTGKTSIEVAVEVYSENPAEQTCQFINKVHLVFVALDKFGIKHEVIKYKPVSKKEILEFEQAGLRREKRILEAKEIALANDNQNKPLY